MKLYDCLRNSWVLPLDDVEGPPGARQVSAGEPVKFHNIDGMYSYCTDTHGKVVHLPAWTEVSYSEPQ